MSSVNDNKRQASTTASSRDATYAPLQTRTEYPLGTDHYRVVTAPPGVQTVSRNQIVRLGDKYSLIDETFSAGVTNRSTRIPGAAPIEERFWDGKWTRETRSTAYNADGCRVDCVVSEASDFTGPITNSVTTYDCLGRVACVQTPAFGGGWLTASNFYDGVSSRVLRSTRTGQPDTLYQYDALGNLTATALDVDGNGVFTAADFATSTTQTHEQDGSGDWWRVTVQAQSCGGVTNSLGVTQEQVSGLSPSRLSSTVAVGANSVTTAFSRAFDPGTDEIADVLQTGPAAPSVRRTLYGHELESAGLGSTTLAGYDGFARTVSRTVTNGAGTVSTSTVIYDTLGNAVTNAATYGNLTAVTTTGYNAQGRAISQTDALGNIAETTYDSLGNVLGQRGATYPVSYTYDTAGQMTTLATTRDGAAWDATQWLHDHTTGMATNKVYADGSRIGYTYTPDGKPLRTTWARGAWRENAYNALGQTTYIFYSDDTPAISLAYDAFQRFAGATNAVATYTYANDARGAVTNETATIGTNMHTLVRAYDGLHRLASLTAEGDAVHYAFDVESRLSTISNAAFASAYAYTPDGLDAGWTVTVTNGTVISRALTRDTYRRSLVTAITNSVDDVPVNHLDYRYDILNRVTIRNADTFDYNIRSEVTLAIIQPRSTNHYEYDGIGNNVWTSLNGATNAYTANAINQYTNILRASAPPREDALSYDLDGNLLANGVWSYAWDAENRLVAVYSNSTLVVSNAYDHMSRHVLKLTPIATHTFIYDGWNLIQETIQNQQSTITNRFVWGKDLSGTLQGGGGVGGLLAVSLNGTWYFPLYDNNGNVTAYANESGTTVATYTYAAFGRTIVQSGPLADAFPHRFSTKYYDVETGLYYYGYRFYSPILIRWLNRDPSGEGSGNNLYGFGINNAVNAWDYLGLWVLNLISNNTTEDDALIWKIFSYINGATMLSGVSSIEDVLSKAEQQLIMQHGEAITELNLSGHGVGGGSGISFHEGASFDLLNLSEQQKKRLKNLLAPYARIKIWSCDSAQSETQCRGLAGIAVELGVSIEAKNTDVYSGPDLAGPIADATARIVAYFMKSEADPRWIEFKPLPSISGPKKSGPQVKIIKVREINNGK